MHRNGAMPGFVSCHVVHRLVHFEQFADMERAIAREKQLKNWRRSWKIALIEEGNPFWEDRAVEFGFEALPSHPSTTSPSSPPPSSPHRHPLIVIPGLTRDP
jgi:hypothetical protein